MTGSRESAGWGLLAALLWLAGSLALPGPPDLRPVMPEVDGVHPVRALEAVGSAYALGGGFLDKYPPLASVLMGLAVRGSDEGLQQAVEGLAEQPPSERRVKLWLLRDRLADALAAERWISRLAMAAAIGLLAALGLAVSGRAGWRAGLAALLAALAFGFSYPALYYGATTNVDALALAAGLLTLWLSLRRRWVAAALAAALAVACKDPAFVLGPVVLIGAWADREEGRARRLLAVTVAGLLGYALLAGALTGPGVWWEHLRYLSSGGVAGPDRIDHGRVAEWWYLLRYGGVLARGAIGVSGVVFGLIGLGLLLAANRAAGFLLLGAIASTWLLFVAPVGFVYVRFLLLPMALLALGVGLMLMRCFAPAAEGRRPVGRWLLLLLLFVAGAWYEDGDVLDYHRHMLPFPDARAELPAALAARVPDGRWIVVFADEREHGPPIDPERWSLDVRGLDAVGSSLAGWQQAPLLQRPDALVFMSFDNELPSGRPTETVSPPDVGDRLGDIYEVVAVFGAPIGAIPERTLAARPTVTLVLRIGG